MVEAASLVKRCLVASILDKACPSTPQLAFASICAAISCLNRFNMRVCTDASSELVSVLCEVQLSIPFTIPPEIAPGLSEYPSMHPQGPELHTCDDEAPDGIPMLPDISYPRILDVSND